MFFKDGDGRSYRLEDIPISWTIGQLKRKLGGEKALDYEHLRLIYGNKTLRDGKHLKWEVNHNNGPLTPRTDCPIAGYGIFNVSS